MKLKILTALAATTLAAAALAPAAQANTGCVSSNEWNLLYAGESKAKAQSVMGATGTRVGSSTTYNANGTRTLRDAIRYTPCSSLSGLRPTITYTETVSASWTVLLPWYLQDKALM